MTSEELAKVLEYDGETGLFRWKMPRRKMARSWFPGSEHRSGYMAIQINRRSYLAHRLAFLLMTGNWPNGDVDHFDRVRSNNKWSNLRAVTASQNGANKGVWKNKLHGLPKGVFKVSANPDRFVAKIALGGRLKHLGTFGCIEDAAEIYAKSHKELTGDFECYAK
jgi:hypothetical protein